jgi:hypothetical protein
MSSCRECDRPIRWAITERGKRMPLDPEPTTDPVTGTAAVHQMDGDLHVRILGKNSPGLFDGEWRMVPHFGTCPARKGHRPAVPPPPPAQPALVYPDDNELVENWEEFKADGWVLLNPAEPGFGAQLAEVAYGVNGSVPWADTIPDEREPFYDIAERVMAFLRLKAQ